MSIITTTYSGPDLDGYGCAVAYAEFLNLSGDEATAHVWGIPHIEVQWLLNTFSIEPVSEIEDASASGVVLLDASSPEDLPGGITAEQVVEVIDHRKIHSADKFVNAMTQIELVGAAATLVAERFKDADLVPSKESALLLLGGIISNTQNFTAVSTDRDVAMAEWMREICGAPADLAEKMFAAKSDLSGNRLKETLLGDFKLLHISGKNVGIAQLEIVGVAELLKERMDEIKQVLSEIERDSKADILFLNAKDLNSGESHLLCHDQDAISLLKSLPGTVWSNNVAVSKEFTLRKQLSSWITDNI